MASFEYQAGTEDASPRRVTRGESPPDGEGTGAVPGVTVRMNVRVPRELHAVLGELSYWSGRAKASYVVEALTWYLPQLERLLGEIRQLRIAYGGVSSPRELVAEVAGSSPRQSNPEPAEPPSARMELPGAAVGGAASVQRELAAAAPAVPPGRSHLSRQERRRLEREARKAARRG